MQKFVIGLAAATIVLGAPIGRADATVTNIDLSSFYNGDWSGEINGPAIVTGVESGTGNSGSGLTFQNTTGQYDQMFWSGSGQSPNSTDITSLSIGLSATSAVNGLFNNFFGTTNQEASVTFTNSLNQTATYALIGGETIRDYNNDGFVNTISGVNANPTVNGNVTAQVWWSAASGGSDPSSPGSPSTRLDAQSFFLPAGWDGTDLTEIDVTDMDFINGDLILSALQVNTNQVETLPAPEPGSLALLGTALLGLGALGRRRQRRR